MIRSTYGRWTDCQRCEPLPSTESIRIPVRRFRPRTPAAAAASTPRSPLSRRRSILSTSVMDSLSCCILALPRRCILHLFLSRWSWPGVLSCIREAHGSRPDRRWLLVTERWTSPDGSFHSEFFGSSAFRPGKHRQEISRKSIHRHQRIVRFLFVWFFLMMLLLFYRSPCWTTRKTRCLLGALGKVSSSVAPEVRGLVAGIDEEFDAFLKRYKTVFVVQA